MLHTLLQILNHCVVGIPYFLGTVVVVLLLNLLFPSFDETTYDIKSTCTLCSEVIVYLLLLIIGLSIVQLTIRRTLYGLVGGMLMESSVKYSYDYACMDIHGAIMMLLPVYIYGDLFGDKLRYLVARWCQR